jgi:hypothetical protein
MTDDAEVLAELDTQFEPEPDQEELDRRAIAAEDTLDDDSDVDDHAAKARRRTRLAPLRERIIGHLRRDQTDDEWTAWPDLVIAVDRDHRRLAELSPINGRIRQAALALSREGLAEVRLGEHTVFDAVRLLPAGYTSDRED